ncbi:MAG: hypothetical protein ACI9B9_001397 [Halioglobus sp.]|jgi:hypothetical protein
MTSHSYPHPFDTLTLELCQTARRHIRILSPHLDSAVFDNDELCSAISALARRSAQSEVKIIVNDAKPLVQNGHALLRLARRIPSVIRIQTLSHHPELSKETIIIRDRDGLLYKPGDSNGQAFMELESRAVIQDHLEQFDLHWQRSLPNAELRDLRL